MALGDLAEPLGFDSLFALEHHFTGYAMSPSPTQLLSYYAGRTKRITLGTAVIVLPWHDPIRVAEQIALLDVMSGGRCLFGFGRGAASVEYAGFRIPMEEARPRFVEAAQIVVTALTNDSFEWEGEFFKIPRTSIRPRPISHPERRFYASSVSPESAEIMAKLGFGILVIMQNEWPKAAEDIQRYQALSLSVGHAPRPPIILTNVSVAREPRGGAGARGALPGAEVGLDRHALPLLGRPPREREGLRVLRRDGEDVLEDEGRELPQEGDGVLREDPGDGYARRLHPAGRRAATAHRRRPSRHRVRLRRHAARGGRSSTCASSRIAWCPCCNATRRSRARESPVGPGTPSATPGIFAPA